jgi:hypothetical protein
MTTNEVALSKMKVAAASGAVAAQRVSLLAISAWVGLLAGYGEVALNLARMMLRHKVVHQSQHMLWATPLADLVIFAFVGLALEGLRRLFPRLVDLRASFVLFFLAVLAVYFSYPKFGIWAVLILAAGLALQATRMVMKWPRTFEILVRRTLPLALALLVLTAIGMMILFGQTHFLPIRP